VPSSRATARSTGGKALSERIADETLDKLLERASMKQYEKLVKLELDGGRPQESAQVPESDIAGLRNDYDALDQRPPVQAEAKQAHS